MVGGVIFQGSLPKLTSCSTALFIFKVLPSQEETLLGNPRDFKVFHRSLGLPIDSVNLFLKKALFVLKTIFCSLCVAAL